jgi:hypothetical protein
MSDLGIYGVVAEFGGPGELVKAAQAVRQRGYSKFEAYSPYPLNELDDIVPGMNLVPFMVFGGGVLGALTAWFMQYYIAAIDFPINVGGRPLFSWPAFIPITFELTVLFAACAAFFGMLWLCGLPLLHHPIFNLKEIGRASKDRFFLCVEARDLKFNPEKVRHLLWEMDPLGVWEVENE